VIDRFTWRACCAFVLVIWCAVSPIDTHAASVRQHDNAGAAPSAVHDPGTAQLRVENSAGRSSAAPGEFISYDLMVANTSHQITATNTRFLTMFPPGFKYKSGSARLNGASSPDPAVSADGQTLIFSVGDLAAEARAAIHFVAEVTTGSRLGKAVSYASAISGDGGKSNVSKASVLIGHEQPRTKVDPPEKVPTSPATGTPRSSSQKTPQTLSPSLGAAPPVTDVGTPVSQGVAVASQAVALPPAPLPQPSPQTAPAIPKHETDGRMAENANGPERRNLATLIGAPDIAVLADADGQFIRSMADHKTLENESAGQVGETNLLESINTGRSFNRENRAALARTEQAKAQTWQARALMLPSISVHANYGSETSEPSVALDPVTGKNVSSDTHSRTDAALTVRQPLFDLPSYLDWQRRKVLEQARGEDYRVSDGDAYLSTANAYLALVSSRLQTDMTREFESQLGELYRYVEKRASAGAASVSDMARVRARREATLSSRLEQESSHAAAGVEFVRLTNLVPRRVRLPELEDLGVSVVPASVAMAVTAAMKSNPELASLAAEIQAANIDQTTAKGRYLPRVDAEYTENYSLHAGGNPSTSGQRDQRFMVVLNWSLFNGGSDYYNHVERTARHKELQYRLDDQRRRVVQSLTANYATLSTTRERIASGYQELKSISTAAEAMSKRMLSGNQSLLDLLDVYDRLYQVRSRLVSLHILEMSTVAQLVRLAYGTPGAAGKVSAAVSAGGDLKVTSVPSAAVPMEIRGDGDSDKLTKLKSGALSAVEAARHRPIFANR